MNYTRNRGASILAMLMLGLGVVVFSLLANSEAASAAEQDCLLLVLDSADEQVDTAGITVRLVDREGETHTYETNDNGLVLVPCGLLGDSLMFEDTWGHGYCIVLNGNGAAGPRSSLLLDHADYGITRLPLASETGHGTILRLGIGPGSEDT